MSAVTGNRLARAGASGSRAAVVDRQRSGLHAGPTRLPGRLGRSSSRRASHPILYPVRSCRAARCPSCRADTMIQFRPIFRYRVTCSSRVRVARAAPGVHGKATRLLRPRSVRCGRSLEQPDLTETSTPLSLPGCDCTSWMWCVHEESRAGLVPLPRLARASVRDVWSPAVCNDVTMWFCLVPVAKATRSMVVVSRSACRRRRSSSSSRIRAGTLPPRRMGLDLLRSRSPTDPS